MRCGAEVWRAWRGLALVVALTSLGALGCQRRPPAHVYAKASTIDAIGREIEAAAASGADGLAPYFDWEAIGQRATESAEARRELPAFVRGLREGIVTNGAVMAADLAEGEYSYRGVAWRDGRPVARFRFINAEGGFNFHDLVIAVRPTGAAPVVDLHVLLSSEYMSETLLRLSAITGAAGRPGPVARLFGARSITAQDITHLQDFVRHTREGDPEAALVAYAALPPPLQRARAFRIMRVQAASALEDEDRYLAILDETAAALPGDPAVSVLMLDAHTLREQWPACLADLAAIRRAYPLEPKPVSPEVPAAPTHPHLDTLEAGIHLQSGDAPRALAVLDRVLAVEPSVDAHDVALLAALALGEQERARRELDVLVLEYGVDAAVLAASPGYEGLGALAGAPE